MTSTAPARTVPDACPGALQTHAAADGALARVRVPGGTLTAAQLRTLTAAARELGDGGLELTSRGNVQLRGLAEGAQSELAGRLADAGLLPSATHERVRNVLGSVLSGRAAGGHLDVRPWVTALDAGLCADPALAALPGRVLFTLDDGRGDVSGLDGDVGLLATGPGEVALLLAGADSGLRAAPAGAVPLALAAARALLAERAAQGGTAWRLAELADGPARVAARVTGTVGHRARGDGLLRRLPRGGDGPVGAVEQLDGRTALVGVVPLGRLDAATADLLAVPPGGVQLTPWRSVAVPDLPEDAVDDVAAALHRAGLVFDAASPWARVTACAGRPGCAKALADVRADVTAAVAAGALPEGRQHWSGCGRRCGRPRGDVVDVVATGDPVAPYRLEPAR
jgi:precorrin-3B synthase